MSLETNKPLGITILAILQTLAGILEIVLAFITSFITFTGIFLSASIMTLILAVSLWNGRKWACVLSVIGSVSVTLIIIGSMQAIVSSITPIDIIVIASGAIIIYYRANTRAYFWIHRTDEKQGLDAYPNSGTSNRCGLFCIFGSPLVSA